MTTTTQLYEHKLEDIIEYLERVAEKPFYRNLFGENDFKPQDIGSIEDFETVPFTRTEQFLADYDENPPRGSFYSDAVRHITIRPAGDRLMPQYLTDADVESYAEGFGEMFTSMGIEPGDVVVNGMRYGLFFGGVITHMALNEIGAAVVPVGSVEPEQAARWIDEFDADALVSYPSAALEIIAERDVELDLFMGAGEPFTSVPGLREEIREGFGGDTTVVGFFGLAEAGPVAGECRYENGLHISDDHSIVEIVDPESGEPLETDERGEIVVTTLQKEAVPITRFRTGDLAKITVDECECGRRLSLPNGVIGRADNQIKIKEVRFFPDSVSLALADFPALTGDFTVEVSRPSGGDYVEIVCEADNPAAVDTDELREALEYELFFTPDQVEVVDSLQSDQQVIDHRYSSAQ